MPFPLIPVLGAAVVAAVGYAITRSDKKKDEVPKFVPGVQPPQKRGIVARREATYPGQRKYGRGVDLPTPPGPKLLPGPTPSPVPQPRPIPTPGGAIATVIARGGLNVRSQPNTSGNILTGLTMGTKVKVPEPNNLLPPTAGAPKGWYKIISPNGVTGYGSAEYIIFGAVSPLPAPRPSPAPAPTPIAPIIGPTQGTIMAPSGLNIRDKPNTTGKKLVLLPKGSKVLISDDNDVGDGGLVPSPATPGAPQGWWKVVTANNITGFGSAEFINIGSPNIPPQPRPRPEEQIASRIAGELYEEDAKHAEQTYGSKLIG